MPRTNKPRSITSEANLARRIAHEREQRALSYEALAKLMTDAGCPVQGSAIYKIEKSEPPRRITVNELAALAEVFEVDVADLMRPIEDVESEYARHLVEEMRRNQRNLGRVTSDLFNALVDLGLAKQKRGEVYDFVMGNWFQNPLGLTREERDENRRERETEPVHVHVIDRIAYEAQNAMLRALVRAAMLWITASDRELTQDEVADLESALADEDNLWIQDSGWLFDRMIERTPDEKGA